jgi:hypothetical protein
VHNEQAMATEIRMSEDVVTAAAEGDEETVKTWLTNKEDKHNGHVVMVIYHALRHGHDNICQL